MKIVGLTGGIGSGKTTVANFFRELGAPVYIADDEAAKLMHTDALLKKKIIAIFGEKSYRDGILNKEFIASHVFNNKEQLKKLNAIVHPAVERHFKEWKKEQYASYIIYEAAILFETGSYKKFDFNILVTAPQDERIKRIQQRDNSQINEIKARMANQWPDSKKENLADFVLNNINISNTKKEVIKIHQFLLKTP